MTYILIAIVVILALWVVLTYNGLVTKRNRAQEAWADIDVQLKRRYDLIPNLVNTVKGYAAHESDAFENVTKARAAAMGAATGAVGGAAALGQGGGLAARAQAEDQLGGALRSIFAIAEAYPDLKANQNFMALQSELTDTEDKIQAARRFYNGNVRDLNTAIQVFPGSMIAGMSHFVPMEYFQLDKESEAAVQQPVQVKF